MKWMVLAGDANRTPAQQLALLRTFLHNKLSLPNAKLKTTKYADPVIHPTNGTIAIAIVPRVENFLSTSPINLALKTTEELQQDGFWKESFLPLSKKAPVAEMTFLEKHQTKIIATAGVGAAAAAMAAAHFIFGLI